MEPTKEYVENMIAQGDWTQRDIGWFRIDIERHPELALDDSGKSAQWI